MTTQAKFADEIDQVIDYFRKEFDLTYYDAIGVLTHTVHRLANETIKDEEDEDS